MKLKEVCTIRKNKIKKGRSIELYSKDKVLLNTYPSVKEASRQLKLNERYIREMCIGLRNHKEGLILKYKNPISNKEIR